MVDGRERDDKDRNVVVLLQSYCDEDRIGSCQKVPVMLRKSKELVGPFSAAYGIDHTGGGGVSNDALSCCDVLLERPCGSSARQAREIVVSGGAVAVPQKSHHSQVPC